MKPRIIVLDTETTAVDPPIGVVELAWVELDYDLNVIGEFSTLVNPEMAIGCIASGINGIRQEDIDEANPPTLSEVAWPEGEILLVCHNVPFDRKLVDSYMNIVEELCTLQMARRLLPDSPNHQLQTLGCYCDLPREKAHAALGDVLTVVHLIKYLLAGGVFTEIEELVDYSKQLFISEKISFGAHKGKLWTSVPTGYLQWILKSDFDRDNENMARYYLSKRG